MQESSDAKFAASTTSPVSQITGAANSAMPMMFSP